MADLKPQLLYTDGGSRGNPGPAATAYAIFDSAGNLLDKEARYIGEHTNNEAEYEALLWGIEQVRKRSCQKVRIFLDSELVVKQTTGEYKVRDEDLKPYARKVASSRAFFVSFEIIHARRSDPRIRLTDKLVNDVLAQKGFPKK